MSHPHPTDLRGEPGGAVYDCPACLTLWDRRDLMWAEVTPDSVVRCPHKNCLGDLVRAACDTCGEPATRIDVDLPVNAAFAYCDAHGLGR